MTENIAAAAENEEQRADRPAIPFHIDLGWYEEHRRSFASVARSRMCPSCRQRAEEEAQARPRQPSSGQDTPAYGDDPFGVISEHCGRDPAYVSPGMPLMEAFFRLFLASGNRPATAEDMIEELRERESYGRYWPMLTAEGLERMLRQDTYYGFRPLPDNDPVATLPPD